MKLVKDRFTNGFVAGILAGILPMSINLACRALGLTELLWSDFLAMYTFGQLTNAGPLHMIFSMAMEFILLGFLGGIFARYVIPSVSSRYQLFKGVLYGIMGWMLFFSIPYIFRLPLAREKTLETAMTSALSAMTWGLAMSFILKRLDKRTEQ